MKMKTDRWVMLVVAVMLTTCGKDAEHHANHAPEISNFKVTADKTVNVVEIVYDLVDKENDDVNVELRVSNNFGRSFTVPLTAVSGDMGKALKPARGKRITWKYPQYIHDIETYVFKLVVNDTFQIPIAELLDKVDTDRIYDDLKNIVGSRDNTSDEGKLHKNKTLVRLQNEFRSHRLQDFTQRFESDGLRGENVFGKHRGTSRESSVLVLGAHFDTVEGSPGADDNGSGLAGMLETMRVISDYQLESSVVFAGWDLEEDGSLGSIAYVRNGGIEDYEQVDLYINLDMIGYFSDAENTQSIPEGFDQVFPDVVSFVKSNQYKADFLVGIANSDTRKHIETFRHLIHDNVPGLKLASLVVEGTGEEVPRLRDSDHSVFWDYGMPAFSLGDGGETRNPYYDTPSDLISTVDINKVADVAKALVAYIAVTGKIIHGDVETSTNVIVRGQR